MVSAGTCWRVSSQRLLVHTLFGTFQLCSSTGSLSVVFSQRPIDIRTAVICKFFFFGGAYASSLARAASGEAIKWYKRTGDASYMRST